VNEADGNAPHRPSNTTPSARSKRKLQEISKTEETKEERSEPYQKMHSDDQPLDPHYLMPSEPPKNQIKRKKLN